MLPNMENGWSLEHVLSLSEKVMQTLALLGGIKNQGGARVLITKA